MFLAVIAIIRKKKNKMHLIDIQDLRSNDRRK